MTPEDFEVEDYRRAAGLTILGQEILVDYADYPTPQIERNSHLYRPLGLGFANLGAHLLMANGLPYDSVSRVAIVAAASDLA